MGAKAVQETAVTKPPTTAAPQVASDAVSKNEAPIVAKAPSAPQTPREAGLPPKPSSKVPSFAAGSPLAAVRSRSRSQENACPTDANTALGEPKRDDSQERRAQATKPKSDALVEIAN